MLDELAGSLRDSAQKSRAYANRLWSPIPGRPDRQEDINRLETEAKVMERIAKEIDAVAERISRLRGGKDV